MSLQLPQIKGENLIIAISASSSAPLLDFRGRDMTDAINVEPDEVIDILEPGFCLIEMPDEGRFIARMESGTVTGPIRIMQIEEFDVEALQAKPVPVNKALAVIPGETTKDIPVPKQDQVSGRVLTRYALPAGSIMMGAALLTAGANGNIGAHEAMIASALGAANLAFGLVVLVMFGRKRQPTSARRNVVERAEEARKRRASTVATPVWAG